MASFKCSHNASCIVIAARFSIAAEILLASIFSPVGVGDQHAVLSRGFFGQTADVRRRLSPVAGHPAAAVPRAAAAARRRRARSPGALFGPYLGRAGRYLAPRVPRRRGRVVDGPLEPAPLGDAAASRRLGRRRRRRVEPAGRRRLLLRMLLP